MTTPSRVRFGKDLQKLQISDIESLIQNEIDESQNLEYKEPSGNLKDDCNYLAKTISGFLNTDGGILIYGVCEKKQNGYSYPSNKKWCNVVKERFENLLKSRVHPWEEKINIYRIENKENKQHGIFVIEVPKSDNPPHMHNYRYYQRLNYQTQPMSHETIFRVFQTSWIRRRELYREVIEPLYSEISMNCNKSWQFTRGEMKNYQRIISENRYLYDQLESHLRDNIDLFYVYVDDLHTKLSWAHKIATKIINEELSKVFDDYKDWIKAHMKDDNLFVFVKVKDPDGGIRVISRTINEALFERFPIKKYLQKEYRYDKVVSFKPIFHPTENIEIPNSTFNDMWERCKLKAAKDKTYLSMWKEIPELLVIGKEILGSILGKQFREMKIVKVIKVQKDQYCFGCGFKISKGQKGYFLFKEDEKDIRCSVCTSILSGHYGL